MKRLVRSLMGPAVFAALGIGTASATPKDQDAQTKTASASSSSTGGKRASKEHANRQTAEHPIVYHGNPTDLPRPHFSATQARHVRSTEAASETRDAQAKDAQHQADVQRPVYAGGFEGAKARMKAQDAKAELPRSARKPDNDVVSGKGSSQAGDMDMSSSTGERTQRDSEIRTQNTVVPNDFASTKQQEKRAEKMADERQPLHLSAKQAQQLSGGDADERGSRAGAFSGIHVQRNEPRQGAHNNYAEVRDRVRETSSFEKLGHMRTPSKFYR